MTTLDTAVVGTVVQVGHPTNRLTATKRDDGCWYSNTDGRRIELDPRDISGVLALQGRRPLGLGDQIHGYANGVFGRDSYACRVIEAAGPDWIITRNTSGEPEFATRADIAQIRDPNDRDYCSEGCNAR